MSNYFAVIMAGGYGERFWPLSTKKRPKQFIDLIDNKSLIEMTIDRIPSTIPKENIIIITNNDHIDLTKNILPQIPDENIIGEPYLRDTGAAITTSLAIIKKRNPNAVFCVLASDHFIDDVQEFNNTILESMKLAYENEILITIGIKPSFPSTGYGYIKTDDEFKNLNGLKYFYTNSFVEKPNLDKAKEFMTDNRYFWNSGIFIWSVKTLEKSLKLSSQLFKFFTELSPYIESENLNEGLKILYPNLNKISIDYELMEKANNIVMVHGNFSWSDVGSWDSLEKLFAQDKNDNTFIGKIDSYKSFKNTVYSKNKSIKLIGVEGLVIVETDDGILVCKKGYEQDIKKTILLSN